MDPAILKLISDAGLGMGAVIALVVVVIYQVRLMGRLSDQIQGITKNIEANTIATHDLISVMQGFRETDHEIKKVIEKCKLVNS